MINKLKKKFIIASAISIFTTVTLIGGLTTIFNVNKLNKTIDALSVEIIETQIQIPQGTTPPFINEFPDESKEGTRYFTAIYNENVKKLQINLNHVSTVDESSALSYCNEVLNSTKTKGWIDNFRYNVYENEEIKVLVFTDGAVNKMITISQIIASLIIIYSSGLVVLTILFILSNKIVRPIAESYKKQKEFITNINHELKTPLTLVNANLDIIENENGKSEWIDDTRVEIERMNELINKLVMLSKLDEHKEIQSTFSTINFSELILSATKEFKPLTISKEINITTNIEENISFNCNLEMIQRLVGILLDNAIKYCDEKGTISVSLKKKNNIIFEVSNTYNNIDNIKLDSLFDRFYREEKSRSTKGSYGIGLSIAQMICEQHNGKIIAEKINNNEINFKVSFK